jgi:tetratricopeptide (TPR) repeat protein
VAPKPAAKPAPKPNQNASKPSSKPDHKPAAKPAPSVVTRGTVISPRGSVQPPVSKPSVKPSAKPAPKPSQQVAKKPDGGGNGDNRGGGDNRNQNNNRNVRASRPAVVPSGNARAASMNLAGANANPAGPRGGGGGGGGGNDNRPNANQNNNNNRPNADKGGSGGGQGGNENNQAARPSRINTLASRGSTYYNPRAGVYGVSAGGGSAGGGRGGSGGGGSASYHLGGSAGGGGYGVWRHASYAPHRSHYVSPTFCHSVNYAYRPAAWGYRPWWGASYNYSWHNGCWNYGWTRGWTSRYAYYRRPALYYPPGYGTYYSTPATFVPWGLASWTLGRLAYDTGYYSYYNPYVAPPVHTSTTIIRYAEPITVVASNAEPATEEIADTAAEKATSAMDRARDAFRVGDYVSASSAVDEAIAQTPGDPVLHEFRSLVLFALGRFGDSAGVLHSVLASGPGWDWETMIGFYDNADRYTEQFRKLEDYVVAHPDAPEPHFLLGYHYMVGENLEEAYAMFDKVSTLQPRDTVSSQLKALLADSAPETAPEPTLENGEEATPMEADKAPIAEESLHGIWKTKSAEDKAITLSLTALGTFTWNYEGATGEVLSGDWSIDKDGLLVLAATDVQMVGDIALNEDGSLHFLLAGSPEGDPGLTFRKE